MRSKGLTESEIQIACERAGVFTIDPNNPGDSTIISIGQHNKNYNSVVPKTTFEKIKDILSSIALVSGIAYAVYLFYKVFKRYAKLYITKVMLT